MTNEQSLTAALILVERTLEGWKVVPPEANVPRVYREYPLSGSGFLPVNVILDGKFDPDQERSKLLLTEEDEGLVEEAFAAAVAAVKYAFSNEWEDAHLLAKVHAPTRGFGTGSDAETVWWHEQLASFATRVAELPIVDCSSRMLPAITPDGAYADFIVPSLLVESSDRETTVDRMWPLVEATSKLLPPRKELAEAWSDIASGWDSLGLPISRIAVKDLPRWAGAGAETLDDLKVDCDAKQWIALFLDGHRRMLEEPVWYGSDGVRQLASRPESTPSFAVRPEPR